MNNDDIKAIKETFSSIDDDNSGAIEIEELRKAYKHANLIKESFDSPKSNNLEVNKSFISDSEDKNNLRRKSIHIKPIRSYSLPK